MTTPTIRDLEERLAAARDAATRSSPVLRRTRVASEWDDYRRARDAELAAERDLALARGEPTCMPLAWQPRWSAGAPCPHVVSSGHKTFLLYLVADDDPTWDGTTARRIEPSTQHAERLAVASFGRTYGHRFGGPNDEVWKGHPLHGKGLEYYRAHLVVSSPWIAAERTVNAVHSGFRPERWEKLRHYLLLFHDTVFECLAESHEVELVETSFGAALDMLVKRVVAAG